MTLRQLLEKLQTLNDIGADLSMEIFLRGDGSTDPSEFAGVIRTTDSVVFVGPAIMGSVAGDAIP